MVLIFQNYIEPQIRKNHLYLKYRWFYQFSGVEYLTRVKNIFRIKRTLDFLHHFHFYRLRIFFHGFDLLGSDAMLAGKTTAQTVNIRISFSPFKIWKCRLPSPA